MFFVLSKTLDALLSPLWWVLGLLSLCLWLSRRGKKERARLAGWVGLAVLVVFSAGSTRAALFRVLERSTPDSAQPDLQYDTVIVLGGMVEPSARTPVPISYSSSVDRLVLAFDLLHQNRARTAILTGVDEAETMRDQLVRWGISEDRLIVEPRARNTRENAVFSAAIAKERGFRTSLVVTSAFHMLRAKECFAAANLPVDTMAADYRAEAGEGSWLPRGNYLADSELALRELGGRVVYRAVGYARPME